MSWPKRALPPLPNTRAGWEHLPTTYLAHIDKEPVNGTDQIEATGVKVIP
jgi:hypothetical protein